MNWYPHPTIPFLVANAQGDVKRLAFTPPGGRPQEEFMFSDRKPDRLGYLKGSIQTGGDRRSYKVHRLVYECCHNTLIPPHLHINHINGIKTDNRLSNLEVVTNHQNMRHAVDTGLKPKAVHGYRHVKYLKGRTYTYKSRWIASVRVPLEGRKIRSKGYPVPELAAFHADQLIVANNWHLPPYEKALNFPGTFVGDQL